jgi:hypothetical protein
MLAILGLILMAVGYIGALVTSIMLLIANFKESVGWGIASLFLGIPLLVFCIMRFSEVKKPFLLNIGSVVLVILGTVVAAVGAASAVDPAAIQDAIDSLPQE